ncbi:TlpA family protein disulfide reductase [candidate division TA06 bacterium]|uniref:TlpA family protein disulfide reductase n=1 Tax=candidate division TA06 bacterium TaxID=2250710 RepID=A0A523UVZ7_UNCT6|nr:MAG: TlpA family protein disulfide reductase [candidate division TA06 bacterium]
MIECSTEIQKDGEGHGALIRVKSEALMRRAMLVVWAIALCVLSFFACNSYGQIAKIGPDKPRWGELLTVTYDPSAPGAKFSAADKVYIIGWLYFSDRIETVWGEMSGFRHLLMHKLSIKDGVSFVTFYFITMDDWDLRAMVSEMIYRPDGVPGRGAYEQMMSSRDHDYREMFAKEMALYPRNYAAYRTKWFIEASQYDKDSLALIIAQDIDKLSDTVEGEPVGYLYSLSYGYLLLKQEAKSRETLAKMLKGYPSSRLTAHALGDYQYQAFAQNIGGEGPEVVKGWIWETIQRYSNTKFARDKSSSLCWQKDFPLKTMEAICREWIEDEPENPRPYYNLAQAYKVHGEKVEEASSLIEKAVELTHKGKLRLYEDISGSGTEFLLPSGYLVMAELCLMQRNYTGALSAVKAAQALEKETRPESYLVEAQIWRGLSKPSRTESAHVEAWRRGSQEAKDSLEVLYKRKHGSMEGFDEYIRTGSTAGQEEKPSAPSFQVTSLDGKRFDLESLRGKVVVLNFWYLGCAPCRMEIPSLNKLVKAFREKAVVFIAIGLDDDEAMRQFLKETEFAYDVVSKGGRVVSHFGVRGFPTHIIIDQDGLIDTRLTGGSKEIDKNLAPLIERLLGI